MRSSRTQIEATLFVLALVLALVASFATSNETVANTFYFAAWCAALLLLFSLGLRLPLHLRGGSAPLATAGIVVAAVGVGLLANIALYRHDSFFDLTETGRFTPPPEMQTVARQPRSRRLPDLLLQRPGRGRAAGQGYAFRSRPPRSSPAGPPARSRQRTGRGTKLRRAHLQHRRYRGGRTPCPGRQLHRSSRHRVWRRTRAEAANTDRVLRHRPWRALWRAGQPRTSRTHRDVGGCGHDFGGTGYRASIG